MLINKCNEFAVITATIESAGDGHSVVNIARNDSLRVSLSREGRVFDMVLGFYKGVDQGISFFIPGICEADALAIAQSQGQESIITEKGLVFCDGRATVSAIELLTGEAAKATGNYTQHLNGDCWAFKLAEPENERYQSPTC